MVKWNKYMLLFLICVQHTVWAQVNRYVVYFEDKEGSNFAVENPEAFLSTRAIERRTRQGIEITAQDLPVTEQNLSALREEGIIPIFTSRWLNAVLIEVEESQLVALEESSIITSYELAAPGAKLNNSPEDFELSQTANIPDKIEASSAEQLRMMGVDDMHADGFTGEGLSVAVLDAGFLNVNESVVFDHVFDSNRLLDYHDFTTNETDVFQHDEHGTNALSCIVSRYEDDIIGTGYGATISLYITEDVGSEYRIEEYNWLFAAERADSAGVDIISSSLGYYSFDDPNMDYTYSQTNGQVSIVSQAAQLATEKGILVVNSVGNEGNNSNWPYMVLPADVDGVLAVGGTDIKGSKVSFSSFGPTTDGRIKPDVSTLGVNVTVLGGGNNITGRSGTSFSAPLVTGFAAGLWQKYPELTNLELKELILASGNQASAPDTLLGYGIPNYHQAVKEPVLSITEIMDEEISVFPNPFSGNHISVSLDTSGSKRSLSFAVLAPDGREISRKSISRPREGTVYKIGVPGNSKGVFILQVTKGGRTKNVKILRY